MNEDRNNPFPVGAACTVAVCNSEYAHQHITALEVILLYSCEDAVLMVSVDIVEHVFEEDHCSFERQRCIIYEQRIPGSGVVTEPHSPCFRERLARHSGYDYKSKEACS